MLEQAFIEERKKELLSKKQELEKELSGIATKSGDDYEPKFPSIGDKDEDNELEVSNFDQRVDAEQKIEQMLKDINAALERIEKGTYGHCDNCDKEIDPARLKAIPWAVTCLDCDEK